MLELVPRPGWKPVEASGPLPSLRILGGKLSLKDLGWVGVEGLQEQGAVLFSAQKSLFPKIRQT